MKNDPADPTQSEVVARPEGTTDFGTDGVVWRDVASDPSLSRPPSAGSPGNAPPGDDLRLDIGWDRFEKLILAVVRAKLGVHQVKFRRYGVAGQKQHGIDLAGRRPDRSYVVVQCKDYDEFTAADLRTTVAAFANGRRPFAATELVIAVSSLARTTQVTDELAVQQEKHPDLTIELWDSEDINDVLRRHADIVSRFWTRETAETFCTQAPLPGAAAPAPDWLRLADQVLLSPLNIDGLDEQVAEAVGLRPTDPSTSSAIYGQIADTVERNGFTGHSGVLRRRQLDCLIEAKDLDGMAELSGQLIATALHGADTRTARLLNGQLRKHVLMTPQGGPAERDGGSAVARPASAAAKRHAQLADAALDAAIHPLGETDTLFQALRNPPPGVETPRYQPLLVLMLAELTLADSIINPPDSASTDPSSSDVVDSITELDGLVREAITQLGTPTMASTDQDVLFRLKLIRAHHDPVERAELLRKARTHELTRTRAGLVLSNQARRDALAGSAEEAIEHWRAAIEKVVLEGRTDDARDWLYAIRAVKARFGPHDSHLEDEHLVALGLPISTAGALVHRVRDPESDARRNTLNDHPNEAIIAARRWLADSIVTGAWTDESMAAELLGDLYADNSEPTRAACCYQWAGESKKLIALAEKVEDLELPFPALGHATWWTQHASLGQIYAQRDLLDDAAAGQLLRDLMTLIVQGRAGELIEDPAHLLTDKATKLAAALAARGCAEDAEQLLDLFAGDVARTESQYRPHDDDHVLGCREIIAHHPDLAWPAIVRIFDLADVGTDAALAALTDEAFVVHLRDPSESANGTPRTLLTAYQRQTLRGRLRTMAAAGRYQAAVAETTLGGVDDAVQQRAVEARDRLLSRPEPRVDKVEFGSLMVPDSFRVSILPAGDRRACLEKMLTVAADRREAARNRAEALIAAANLVIDQDDDTKRTVHLRSRSFVEGHEDGSFLDAETTNPHPLSAFQVNMGSTGLRASGLHLAVNSATDRAERLWVRQQATGLLGSRDRREVHAAAMALSNLDPNVLGELDAAMFAAHGMTVIRQLAAIVAIRNPKRFADTLRALATDENPAVRSILAQRVYGARAAVSVDGESVTSQFAIEIMDEILAVLAGDVRHSIRWEAMGRPA